MFRTVPMYITRGLAQYTQQWYGMSYRFADSLLARSGRNFRSDPAHKLVCSATDLLFFPTA